MPKRIPKPQSIAEAVAKAAARADRRHPIKPKGATATRAELIALACAALSGMGNATGNPELRAEYAAATARATFRALFNVHRRGPKA